MKEISVKSGRLYVFIFFYICSRSLLINTRLVFISYLVSVPLRKGYRGLEYKYLFVRLYLFFFAFLIIYIETFGFRRLFCNITCSVLALAILIRLCGSLYYHNRILVYIFFFLYLLFTSIPRAVLDCC